MFHTSDTHVPTSRSPDVNLTVWGTHVPHGVNARKRTRLRVCGTRTAMSFSRATRVTARAGVDASPRLAEEALARAERANRPRPKRDALRSAVVNVARLEVAAGGRKRPGTLRWRGAPFEQPGTWLGVELDAPEDGRGDGVLRGRRHFRCAVGHAIFVRQHPDFASELGGSSKKAWSVAVDESAGSVVQELQKRVNQLERTVGSTYRRPQDRADGPRLRPRKKKAKRRPSSAPGQAAHSSRTVARAVHYLNGPEERASGPRVRDQGRRPASASGGRGRRAKEDPLYAKRNAPAKRAQKHAALRERLSQSATSTRSHNVSEDQLKAALRLRYASPRSPPRSHASCLLTSSLTSALTSALASSLTAGSTRGATGCSCSTGWRRRWSSTTGRRGTSIDLCILTSESR